MAVIRLPNRLPPSQKTGELTDYHSAWLAADKCHRTHRRGTAQRKGEAQIQLTADRRDRLAQRCRPVLLRTALVTWNGPASWTLFLFAPKTCGLGPSRSLTRERAISLHPFDSSPLLTLLPPLRRPPPASISSSLPSCWFPQWSPLYEPAELSILHDEKLALLASPRRTESSFIFIFWR